MLDQLKLKPTRRQLEARETAFEKWERKIPKFPPEGLCSPYEKSEYPEPANGSIRVDAVIDAGQAFVD